ncbi:MAG: hypothetical protein AB7D34_01240 [Sulfurimonas sp.]
MNGGMFAFIFRLFTFMTFYVVDSDGAGSDQGGDNDGSKDGDGQDSDIGDLDLGGNEDNDESASALSAEEIKAAKQIIADNNYKATISAVEKEIQKRIPDFSADKVIASLQELHKTDPEMAKYYNASPAAWEMYFKDHVANVAKSDAINTGSHSGSGSDFGSVLEKARGGDKKSGKAALEMSKA